MILEDLAIILSVPQPVPDISMMQTAITGFSTSTGVQVGLFVIFPVVD